jgi:hypothetical protein
MAGKSSSEPSKKIQGLRPKLGGRLSIAIRPPKKYLKRLFNGGIKFNVFIIYKYDY